MLRQGTFSSSWQGDFDLENLNTVELTPAGPGPGSSGEGKQNQLNIRGDLENKNLCRKV